MFQTITVNGSSIPSLKPSFKSPAIPLPNAETATLLGLWGIFAAGFVVRPLGALIFGHIGDTVGRNKTLTISIICMALPTVIIGYVSLNLDSYIYIYYNIVTISNI